MSTLGHRMTQAKSTLTALIVDLESIVGQIHEEAGGNTTLSHQIWAARLRAALALRTSFESGSWGPLKDLNIPFEQGKSDKGWKGAFICPMPMCVKETETYGALTTHCATVHALPPQITCNICNVKWATWNGLAFHYELAHKLPPTQIDTLIAEAQNALKGKIAQAKKGA